MATRVGSGLVALLVLLSIGSYVHQRSSTTKKQEEAARAFVRRYLRLFQARDLKTAYLTQTTASYRKAHSYRDHYDKSVLVLDTLGPLRFYQVTSFSSPSKGRFTLVCRASFENEDNATMIFELHHSGNELALEGWRVDSDRLKEVSRKP